MLLKRPLTIAEILHWADAFRETTGNWPTQTSGAIVGTRDETWANVDNALRCGLRGLPGGSSLAQLLTEQRGVRNIHRLPPLTEHQILAWADAHHQRTGTWPTKKSGKLPDSGGERWSALDGALQLGNRGLPGGSSLAQILAAHRGVRNRKALPHLTEDQILAWADAHHARTGRWPHGRAGPVADVPGETWTAIDVALYHGRRGLPGGSSLAWLLADRRGVRHHLLLPNLSIPQILDWADACHARSGCWPQAASGPLPEAPRESWSAIDIALKQGHRGLPGGTSLAKLLVAERGVRHPAHLPPLSRQQILAWAVAYHARTGRWPTAKSGTIAEAPGETWAGVNQALRDGTRSLRGGASLARLLAQHGKKRHHLELPRLSKRKILAWADAHVQRTGQWPTVNSGVIQEAPDEKWDLIDNALRVGLRGLPGGSSLARLLARKRGVRNPMNLPALTEAQIVEWAERHFQRTQAWPQCNSGPIVDAPGETWAGVNWALAYGKRSLTGGSSLAKLLAQRRGGGGPSG